MNDATEHPQAPLGDMPAEEFRKHGHEVVDWIANFLSDIGSRTVVPDIQPGSILSQLPAAAPQQGEEMSEILADFERIVMPGIGHWNHPRFFAYFNSSGTGPGILAEMLSSALNVNSMLWQACPAATELEQCSTSWVREMLGLPNDLFGVIYEGGSTSTFHALAAARSEAGYSREDGLYAAQSPYRVYTSEHGHSSIDKAAIALGLGTNAVRHVAVDADYRMDPDALRSAIAEDRDAGLQPVCVVATVGTTSCTSIDPVRAIADVCEDEGLWLHVDAAHGAAAAVVPEMRHVLDGCDRADSIVVNPHKWLFVPLDLSILFTRKPEVLRNAFSLVPEYLRTNQTDVVNYMDYGIPLGRRFRALKLWFVLRYFGVEGIAARIRDHLRLARLFAGWVDESPQFERLAPVPLSTVCFRAHPPGLDEPALNELNENLMREVNRTGDAFLSHTKLNDRYTLRLVISHIRTSQKDVERVWEIVQSSAARL